MAPGGHRACPSAHRRSKGLLVRARLHPGLGRWGRRPAAPLPTGRDAPARHGPHDQCDLRWDFRPCRGGRRAAILKVTPSSWREALAVRLTWKDGVCTPFVEAAVTLVGATGAFWFAAATRYALEAPAGAARSCATHEVICQDGAAQR